MKRTSLCAALIVLATAAVAVPPPAAFTPQPGEPYWFKTYSTAPYKETWGAELTVKDLGRAMPTLLKAVEKSGGKLSQPLSSFASKKDESQQLSFDLPSAKIQALLKDLRRLGDLSEPRVGRSGSRIPRDEVKKKIDALMKEKSEHAADLARVPATAAAAEEILEHLLLVEEVSRRSEDRVLFDLQVTRR